MLVWLGGFFGVFPSHQENSAFTGITILKIVERFGGGTASSLMVVVWKAISVEIYVFRLEKAIKAMVAARSRIMA